MEKHCTRCDTTKPREFFCKDSRAKDGLQVWCKQCFAEVQREWRRKNPQKVAESNRRSNERMRRRYHENEEVRRRAKEDATRWRRRNPERFKQQMREQHLRRTYGLTDAEFNRLAAIQGGRCACCGKKPRAKLRVDHDHQTGQVRGLVCSACNTGIGLLGDTEEALERALNYLRRHHEAWQPLTFVG